MQKSSSFFPYLATRIFAKPLEDAIKVFNIITEEATPSINKPKYFTIILIFFRHLFIKNKEDRNIDIINIKVVGFITYPK